MIEEVFKSFQADIIQSLPDTESKLKQLVKKFEQLVITSSTLNRNTETREAAKDALEELWENNDDLVKLITGKPVRNCKKLTNEIQLEVFKSCALKRCTYIVKEILALNQDLSHWLYGNNEKSSYKFTMRDQVKVYVALLKGQNNQAASNIWTQNKRLKDFVVGEKIDSEQLSLSEVDDVLETMYSKAKHGNANKVLDALLKIKNPSDNNNLNTPSVGNSKKRKRRRTKKTDSQQDNSNSTQFNSNQTFFAPPKVTTIDTQELILAYMSNANYKSDLQNCIVFGKSYQFNLVNRITTKLENQLYSADVKDKCCFYLIRGDILACYPHYASETEKLKQALTDYNTAYKYAYEAYNNVNTDCLPLLQECKQRINEISSKLVNTNQPNNLVVEAPSVTYQFLY